MNRHAATDDIVHSTRVKKTNKVTDIKLSFFRANPDILVLEALHGM